MVVLSLFSDQTKAEAFASARRRAGHASIVERIGSYWQVAVYLGDRLDAWAGWPQGVPS